MVLSSDPKPSYPAGVTTEKENWAFWAKAWWAFTGMWQQRRTFFPYGEHKGLAWLLFLHASWGTAAFVPQKTGLLCHLPLRIVPTQLHWHGKKLLGIFCAAQRGEMSCPYTSCLPGCEASSRCHHPAPADTTQLTGCGFSRCYRNYHNCWLCLRKVRLGTSTQSSEPKLTSILPIYLLLEEQGGKERCYTGWVTYIWLTSATVKSVGVYWVYPVGMRVCYIRRLYKETVIHTYNAQQRGKNLLTHVLHTMGA